MAGSLKLVGNKAKIKTGAWKGVSSIPEKAPRERDPFFLENGRYRTQAEISGSALAPVLVTSTTKKALSVARRRASEWPR